MWNRFQTVIFQKINPEEMKRLEEENSKLNNQLKQTQTQLKSHAIHVNNLGLKIKEADEKLTK